MLKKKKSANKTLLLKPLCRVINRISFKIKKTVACDGFFMRDTFLDSAILMQLARKSRAACLHMGHG